LAKASNISGTLKKKSMFIKGKIIGITPRYISL
jgi:hypothetical protein